MKRVIPYLLAIILLMGAFGHFAAPEMYVDFIPSFIPEPLANILAGIAEAALGIGMLIPAYRKYAGLGFLILMVIFLPIHIWDFTKDVPAIGSKTVAGVRIGIQFVLIGLGWFVWNKS